MKVKEIMKKEVVTITKETTVEEIAKILSSNNVSGVPVVDEENRVIGIVTEADLLCKEKDPHIPSYIELLGGIIYIGGLYEYEKELQKLTAFNAERLMTEKVLTIGPEEEVKKAAAFMVENKINRLPVVDEEGKLVGIVSRSDIIKSMI